VRCLLLQNPFSEPIQSYHDKKFDVLLKGSYKKKLVKSKVVFPSLIKIFPSLIKHTKHITNIINSRNTHNNNNNCNNISLIKINRNNKF
jgi:hypothetical protein